MHIALSAVVGLIAGPFLHHLAVQSGADHPFRLQAARCRRCGDPAVFLGRCPGCGSGPARAVLTACLSAALFALTAWWSGRSWLLAAYLFFAGMSVVLLITDLDHKRIPNRITYPATPAAAVLLAITAAADGLGHLVPRALMGALTYAGIFAVIYLVARGGFGFGDVKLAVSLGLFTAFLGWDRLFLAGLATAGIGGVIALVALVAGRAGAKTEIPYGPPMIAGSWLSILAGPWLSTWVL
ncbi:MAG: prepilin peptidase [Actinomycetota bacterium]